MIKTQAAMTTTRTVNSSKGMVATGEVSGMTLHHIRAEVEVVAAGMLKLFCEAKYFEI